MSDQTAPEETAEARTPPSAHMSGPVPTDASAAKDRAEWLTIMDRIGEDSGYFDPVGARHWAFFHDDGPVLLVSFEQLDDIRGQTGQMPLGHELAKARGWSHLCLIADGETWYRDDRLYRYFDRLVDDAFFEDFDQVIFLGAGQQGYAAAAYSVVAPGATAVLISPRATQLPAMAAWDHRTPGARRLDFRSRYGYAPDMVEGLGRVIVIHDPDVDEDAMHAALFRGPHVTHLRTPHLGGRVDWAFGHMQLWSPLIDAAADGTLTPLAFARMWRKRRNFGPYLRGLLAMNADKGHVQREKWICRGVTNRLNAPNFRKRLTEILASEAEAEASAALADLPGNATEQQA